MLSGSFFNSQDPLPSLLPYWYLITSFKYPKLVPKANDGKFTQLFTSFNQVIYIMGIIVSCMVIIFVARILYCWLLSYLISTRWENVKSFIKYKSSFFNFLLEFYG